MIEQKATTFMRAYDWFNKQETHSKLIIVLLVLVGYLGWSYYKNQLEDSVEFEQIKTELEACQELTKEVEDYKLQSILLQASDDQSPNAQWRTAAGTNKVLWCNLAYERKYLRPLGFTRRDLIGTDGTTVFGEVMAKKFAATNDRVANLDRPVIEYEIVKTLKFPIKIGGYIYAIGGMEYEEDFSTYKNGGR